MKILKRTINATICAGDMIEFSFLSIEFGRDKPLIELVDLGIVKAENTITGSLFMLL